MWTCYAVPFPGQSLVRAGDKSVHAGTLAEGHDEPFHGLLDTLLGRETGLAPDALSGEDLRRVQVLAVMCGHAGIRDALGRPRGIQRD
jgi:hypothetical protein